MACLHACTIYLHTNIYQLLAYINTWLHTRAWLLYIDTYILHGHHSYRQTSIYTLIHLLAFFVSFLDSLFILLAYLYINLSSNILYNFILFLYVYILVHSNQKCIYSNTYAYIDSLLTTLTKHHKNS